MITKPKTLLSFGFFNTNVYTCFIAFFNFVFPIILSEMILNSFSSSDLSEAVGSSGDVVVAYGFYLFIFVQHLSFLHWQNFKLYKCNTASRVPATYL